jgi:hypothetical protein
MADVTTEARRALLHRAMTEDELQSAIIKAARLRGWMVAHFRPAKTEKGWRTPVQGDAGFPDLVLARNGRVYFLELKRLGKTATPAQAAWIEAIQGPAPLPNDRVQAWLINTTQLDIVLGWLE